MTDVEMRFLTKNGVRIAFKFAYSEVPEHAQDLIQNCTANIKPAVETAKLTRITMEGNPSKETVR